MLPLAALGSLFRADFAAQRGRWLAGSIALGVAASLLLGTLVALRVWERQQVVVAESFLDDTSVHLAATDPHGNGLDAALITDLRADPRVAGMSLARATLVIPLPGTADGNLDHKVLYSPWVEEQYSISAWGGWIPAEAMRVWAWDGEIPQRLATGRWPAPTEASRPMDIATTPVIFNGMSAVLGTCFRLEGAGGVFSAEVVGQVAGTNASRQWTGEVSPFLPEVLMATEAVERLAGRPLTPVVARIRLQHPQQRGEFLSTWRTRVSAHPAKIRMWDADELLRDNRGFEIDYMYEAMFTALVLVIVCVLGLALALQGSAVRERVSHYALLRALGAGRATLAASVLIGALPLTLGGLVGAVALAWAVKAGLSLAFLTLDKTPPDLVSIALTGLVLLVGTTLGAAWPAWQAASLHPLHQRQVDPGRFSRRCLIASGMVLALVAIAVLVQPEDPETRARLVGRFALPALGLAGLLATPWVVRLVSRLTVPLLARLTLSNPTLLADQVAGDGPRSAGAVAAMGFGFAAFVSTLVWGLSMLNLYRVDPAIPRWFVSIYPGGVDQHEVAQIRADPQLAVFEPVNMYDTWIESRNEPWLAAVQPPPALLIGAPSDRLFDRERPLLPMRFHDGDPETARAALVRGDGCLVGNTFANRNRLRLGDQLPLAVPGGKPHSFAIVGIVEVQGWQLSFDENKTRPRGYHHEALVIADATVVRASFPVAYANFFIGNTYTPDGALTRYPHGLSEKEGLRVHVAERLALESAIASRFDGARRFGHLVAHNTTVNTDRRVVQVIDLDAKRGSGYDDYVRSTGVLPLTVLALALLSLTGSLVASLRARARELGVMRSCGLTRGGLLRLVMGESLVLGSSAIVLGFLFAVPAGWLMLKLTAILGEFAGLDPIFAMPWSWLGPGVVMTLIVCTLAAVWAAWHIGRIPPAELAANGPRR